jgi:cell fate regulator YaaT (PSP1 superfamily)
MPEVVGVRFRKSGKIYDFDPQSLELKPGDHVVVETAWP